MNTEANGTPEEYDPDDVLPVSEITRRLPKYFTISCISKRNSGKSHLISQLVRELLKKKRVDMVIVMSGSAGLTDDWNFLPDKCVMPFSNDMLHKVWDKQIGDEKKTRQHVLIVMDDCLSTKEALRNPTINRYYSLGRHIHSSFIIISQHSSILLTPIIRANSDILLWSKLNRMQLEQLWNSTSNIEKKDFIKISETFGGHHYNFMLLDNYDNSGDPANQLTVVRADK